MLEWLKNLFGRIGKLWLDWSMMTKLILVGVFVIIIVAFVLLGVLSSRAVPVPIFNAMITDAQLAERISTALDAENIKFSRGADGIFYAYNENQARVARSLLVREDLLPGQLDPWNFFTNMDRWTLTDFDRDINLQRALTLNLEQHIAALADVDSAKVTLVIPESELFSADQKPVTASVIINPKPGSDIIENRKKVEGIVKLIQFAVEGLLADNITIMDYRGNVLNDFDGRDSLDRLDLTKRMLRQKRALEAQYTATILESLSNIFTPSRVNIVNFDIDLEFVKKSVNTEEHFPVTIRADDPNTPFSELETAPSIVRSREDSNTSFEGTGFNPEGPPGQEGQTPPAYNDLTNLVGNYESNRKIENFEINKRSITEESNPYMIKRISLGLVIDGTWAMKFDEKNDPIVKPDGGRERSYQPLEPVVLKQAQSVVESAVGYSRERGDVVTVRNIPFDRSEQFRLEDDKWQIRNQIQSLVLWGAVSLFVVIVIVLIIQLISRYVESKRREREDLMARQYQAIRERALKNAEEESLDVEMSVEERTRYEMQDNAKNMARDYPEDVAQLIKTWLSED